MQRLNDFSLSLRIFPSRSQVGNLPSCKLTPKSKGKRGVRRRATQNKSPATAVLSAISAAHHSGVRANVLTSGTDLIVARQSWLLTQHPPKNFPRMIFWIQATVEWSFSVTSALTEANRTFQLSDVAGYTAYTGAFDQFCIYAVIQRYTPGLGNALTAYAGEITTAIDLDNITNLGSYATLLSYGTSLTSEVIYGLSMERKILPCVSTPLVNNTETITGYNVARNWIDSAYASTPHFGSRCIVSNSASTGYSFVVNQTYILGFRNTV